MSDKNNQTTDESVAQGIRLVGSEAPIVMHPLRTRVTREVHARPFEALPIPTRLYKIAYLTDGEEVETDLARLTAFCEGHDVSPPSPERRHHSVRIGSVRLRWERHAEFITYAWQTEEQAIPPFSRSVFADVPLKGMPPPPGAALVAVHLAIVNEIDAPVLETLFQPASLCVSTYEQGAARIATDFVQDAHGFTRILIINRSLTSDQAGSLSQRLLEIETYRTLALLGLPEAEAVQPVVGRIEKELAELVGETRGNAVDINRGALERLLSLASETEKIAVQSSYRFNATQAYSEIVSARLEAIGEQAEPGYSTWQLFLNRRTRPALKTCEVMDRRLADLSIKLARASDLLRTRVNIALEQQNSELLKSMNRRTQLQLRLQHTVEGLSVAAVTYYIVGLIAIVAKGAQESGLDLPLKPGAIAALSVPLVVLLIWLLVRGIRAHFDDP